MSDKVKIGDVCRVYDGPHATPTKISEGPIYLGIDAITEQGWLNPSGYNHLSEEDYVKWTKRVTPQENDIVFSYEATLGRYAMIPKGFYGCLGRRLAIVRAKDERVNPRWLYYYFLSPEWSAYIANRTIRGSTVNRISVEDFPKYEIPLPNREQQDAAVEVLSSIDKSIANNSEILETLEEVGKMMYKQCFIQYEFPNADGKPYCSSGGDMIWCEELKKEIPCGWSIGQVAQLMTISTTSFDPKKHEDEVLEHYSIPAYDDGFYPVYEKGKTIESSKYVVYPDAILTSKLNPHFKRLWDPYIETDRAICSTEFIVYRPVSIEQRPFCYAVLNSDEFYSHMASKAISSTGSRKRIQPEVSASFKLAIPSSDVIERFCEIYSPILERQKKLRLQNHYLLELRAWLLPLLMNGQATIKQETTK